MIKGRAASIDDKRLIMKRLFAAWLEVPSLRFGQLIMGCVEDWSALHAKEDAALVGEVEVMAARLKANRKEKDPK